MRRLRTELTVLLALGFLLVFTVSAEAAKLGSRPNWGACGLFTSESKMVYDFGRIELKCGNPNWGYRHIKARHYNEFQGLARAGGLNWSDLVHWAIYYNVQDPDHVEGDGCRDRVLFLHDSNGRLLWQQRFKLIYSASDGRVITVYPSSSTCR